MMITQQNLPKDWQWLNLVDICKFKRGPFGGSLKKDNFVNTGYKVYEQQHAIQDNFDIGSYYITEEKYSEMEGFALQPNDLIISCSGTMGKVAIVPQNFKPGIINQALLKLTPNLNMVYPSYLKAYLQSEYVQKKYFRVTSGTAIQNVAPVSELKNIKIPLPPFDEQKNIATRLSEQMSCVEQARQATEESLQAAWELPSKYLGEMFENEKIKSLAKVRFDEVAILQRGYDLPSQNQIPGDYPIVTSGGIKGTHREFMAEGPGVVTGRSGSIGKVFYIETNYWPHNTALFVKEFKNNEPRFIFYLLQWMKVKTVSSGTGVPTLDRKQVHNVLVPKIDNVLQSHIYQYLDEKMKHAENLIIALESQLAEINELPSALLRQAFAGQIVGG